MSRTAGQVLTSARQTTNDVAAQRLIDSEGLGYVVDGLNTIRNERPDLFLGNWAAIESIASADPLPIDSQYFRPLADYVIARAQSKDAAHVVSARAELMFKLAGGYLK